MKRKSVLKAILVLLTVTFLTGWLAKNHFKPEEFDEKQFQSDIEEIKTQYFDNQELIQRIVRALWENKNINSVSVSPFSEGSVELWVSDRESESFAEDYPQLYTDVHLLLTTNFTFDCFSRHEEQREVIVCSLFNFRYHSGPHMTSFYLYFYDGQEPNPDMFDYYQRLSDGCFLVAIVRPFE